MQVRELAVESVSGFTTDPQWLPLFKKNDCKVVKDLAEHLVDTPVIAHHALRSLINLSHDEDIIAVLNTPGFLYHIVLMIVLPKSVLADLYCMLLNNMTKNPSVAVQLVPEESILPPKPPIEPSKDANKNPLTSSHQIRTQHLDNLVEVFLRGSTKVYNSSATFAFLAGVFANVSSTPLGARFFLRPSTVDEKTPRLSKLLPVLDHRNHTDVIRRDGVASAVKNCCFAVEVHRELLDDSGNGVDVLPMILLPLMGNEDYSDEDMGGMPDELQLLEDDKTREPDIKIRRILLETLLLLATTRHGRDVMRRRKVYPIMKTLHLAERDEVVLAHIENLVNLLMRDEGAEEEGAVVSHENRVTDGKKKELTIEEMDDDDNE
ncbi:hypothetical protein BJ742DRAFT_536913 [Cladochytrium replicatum]|nr:hypothetical protein BJ742DRAFT_536913 [Cladochytrium replicatum]